MSIQISMHGRDAAVNALAELGAVSSEDDLDAWSVTDRDALRWKLVGWRDEGRREAAETALRLAHQVWPQEPRFLLELMVLRLADPAVDLCETLEACAAELRQYPEVALLLSHSAWRAGDPDAAREHFGFVGDLPIERLTPFANLYREVLDLAVLPPVVMAYCAAAETSSEPLSTPEAQPVIAALRASIIHADRFEDLAHFTRALVYFGTFQAPMHIHLVLKAFETARPSLSISGRSVEISLVLATYDARQALPLVQAALDKTGSAGSAHFARVASVTAARLKDGALERQVLVRHDPPAIQSLPDQARSAEIAERKAALGIGRPLRVFIGFFGQMREPEAVLPQAVAAVRQAFADPRHGEFELSFALSTWAAVGGRPLSLDDSAGFFAQAAPVEVRPLLTGQNGATGRQLSDPFPNLIATLVDHHDRIAGRRPSEAALKSLMPAHSILVVDEELEVDDQVRASLEALGMNYGPIVNQLKMWSRISALGQAFHQHESQAGAAFDVGLLLRCDLANIQGGLTPYAARAVSSYDRTSLFYDHDQHAEFIEGAGDRYMLGSRDVITAMFDGFDHYVGMLRSPAPSPLATRLHAHTAVQSLVMAKGLTPSPVWALGFELHRGAPPLAAVEAALSADARMLAPGDLHDAVQTVLADVRRRLSNVQD